MSWDELIKYNRRWVEAHKDNTFQHEAARRMAVLLDAMEALLAGDVIERAAETMFAYSFALPDEGVKRWGSAASEVKQMHRIKARAALMAALGEDEK